MGKGFAFLVSLMFVGVLTQVRMHFCWIENLASLSLWLVIQTYRQWGDGGKMADSPICIQPDEARLWRLLVS